MKKILTLVALLAMFPTVAEGLTGPKQAGVYLGTKIGTLSAGVDISVAKSFTLNLQPDGLWGLLVVYVKLVDADNSVTGASSATMSCTGSPDEGVRQYTLQSCTTAAGVCTSDGASWQKNPVAITSPKQWVWRVDVEGVESVKCSFPAFTGATAADLLTVDVWLATKGS